MLLNRQTLVLLHQLGISFRSQQTTRTLEIMRKVKRRTIIMIMKTKPRMDWTRRKMTLRKRLKKKMTKITQTAATPSAGLQTVKLKSDQLQTQLATGTVEDNDNDKRHKTFLDWYSATQDCEHVDISQNWEPHFMIILVISKTLDSIRIFLRYSWDVYVRI